VPRYPDLVGLPIDAAVLSHEHFATAAAELQRADDTHARGRRDSNVHEGEHDVGGDDEADLRNAER
jgi:hypothetical protein